MRNQILYEALKEYCKAILAFVREKDQEVQEPDWDRLIVLNENAIRKMAAVTKRPERFLGTHFFNPVP